MIARTAVKLAPIVLLVLMAVNAYFAINHLRRIRQTSELTLDGFNIQANISNVLQDLTDMETGQRGYLLTGNTAYLQPYTEAKSRIPSHFSSLRSALAGRSEEERSLESQLESLSASKQAEIEKTITFRQNGYRHRAFTLVDTNEGKDYMDKSRAILSSLSTMEADNFTAAERDKNDNLEKASSSAIFSNLLLLALAAGLLAAIHYYGRSLEQKIAASGQTVAVRDTQLQGLLSALSEQAPHHLSAIETNAATLLDTYGGFLPRKAQEHAETIKQSAIEMEQLRQDLLRESAPGNPA